MAETEKAFGPADKVRDLLPSRKSVESGLEELRDDLERVFDDVGHRYWFSPFHRRLFDLRPFRRLEQASDVVMPDLDVLEEADSFEISMEVPGMKAEDINISVGEDRITISGKKESTHDEETADYHISERRYGRFERTLALPESTTTSKAEATVTDGILTVSIPKHEKSRRKKVRKLSVKAGKAPKSKAVKSAKSS